MPELPEVETCVRGLKAYAENKKIENVIVREKRLRWPVSNQLKKLVSNKKIRAIHRRAKYIIFDIDQQKMIMHLGMSGTVRVVPSDTPLKKHDHVDIILIDKQVIRYNDPRRFGSIHITANPIDTHFLIENLGPEPLTEEFNSEYLFNALSNRRAAIKLALMNNHIVVGVGNIYANEALFLSSIHPERPANTVTLKEAKKLVAQIKKVLAKAIEQGGTTLKDFVNSDGKPGYFQQTLWVYDRANEPCKKCKTPLELIRLSGRATVFCPSCQS